MVDFIREIDDDGNSREIYLNEEELAYLKSVNSIRDRVLAPMIGQCKKLTGRFKHTEELTRKLKEKQVLMQQEFKVKLCPEIPIRWNSKYDMIDAILMNEMCLKSLAHEINGLVILSDFEFEIADQLCLLLSPLKELTVYLSASKYVTCATIFPAIYTLVHKKLPQFVLDNEDMQIMRGELVRIIQRRFFHVLDDRHNSFYLAACYLDIGYRDMLFVEDIEKRQKYIESAKKFIHRVIITIFCFEGSFIKK